MFSSQGNETLEVPDVMIRLNLFLVVTTFGEKVLWRQTERWGHLHNVNRIVHSDKNVNSLSSCSHCTVQTLAFLSVLVCISALLTNKPGLCSSF